MGRTKTNRLLLERERPKKFTDYLALVPWPPLMAVALFVPGITIWAVYALKCKDSTITFFSTVAEVSPSTIDAVSGAMQTTLITLAVGGAFVFLLGLVLAGARAVQHHKLAPNSGCPCARPSLSSYTMYMAFNVGFNTIVFLVMMAIILLIAGAFLWLVVAYAANSSIRYGVRDAEQSGRTTAQLGSMALVNLTTMVDYYQLQMRVAPTCIKNSTWLKGINGTLANMLYPRNDTGGGNTVLCPYSCLNLGSFATLFKLGGNCICDQERLNMLLHSSMTISTEAGVALGGLVLIYIACIVLNMNLTAQFTHTRHEYFAALEQQSGWRSWSGDGDAGDGDSGEPDPEKGLPPSSGSRIYQFDDMYDDDLGTRSMRLRDAGGSSGSRTKAPQHSGDSRHSSSSRRHKQRGSSSSAKAVAGGVAGGLDGRQRSSSSSRGVGGTPPHAVAASAGSNGGVLDSAREVQDESAAAGGSRTAKLAAAAAAAAAAGDGAAAMHRVASGTTHSVFDNPTLAAAVAASMSGTASRAPSSAGEGLISCSGTPCSSTATAVPAAGSCSSRHPSGDVLDSSSGMQLLGHLPEDQQLHSSRDWAAGSDRHRDRGGLSPSMTLPATMGRQWQQQQQQQVVGVKALSSQGGSTPLHSVGSSWGGGGTPIATGVSLDSAITHLSGSQQQLYNWDSSNQQQQQHQQQRRNKAMRELLLGQVPLHRPVSRTSSLVLPGPHSRAGPPISELTGSALLPGTPPNHHHQHPQQQQEQEQEQVSSRNGGPLQRSSHHSHHTPTSSHDSRDSVLVHEDALDASSSPYAGAVASAALPATSFGFPTTTASSSSGRLGGAGSSSSSSGSRFTGWPTVPQPNRQVLQMISEASPMSPRSSLLHSSLSFSSPRSISDVAAAAAAGAQGGAGSSQQPPQQQQQPAPKPRQQQQQHRHHQRYGAVDLTHLDGSWLTEVPPTGATSDPQVLLAPLGDPPAPAAASGAAAAGGHLVNAASAAPQQQPQEEQVAVLVPPPTVMASRMQAPPRPQPLTIPEQSAPSAAPTTGTTTATTTASSAGSYRAGPRPMFDQSPVDATAGGSWFPQAPAEGSGFVTPSVQGTPHGHHAHQNSVGAGSAASYGSLWGSNPPSMTKAVSFEGAVEGAGGTSARSRSNTPRYDDGRSPSDTALRSPYERQRPGFRSSIRKGLVVYDQYKHRPRGGVGTPGAPPPGRAYSAAVSAATPSSSGPSRSAADAGLAAAAGGEAVATEVVAGPDPMAALSRRYKNRMPAI